jgi:hypothetical protein
MEEENAENSIRISEDIAVKFTTNPDFPYLVSFPRTGSHWLRMLMELYFEKPSFVRAFYYFDATDFTCYHRHDEDMKLERKNVIYLYRDPCPTIYSQMMFYNENVNDGKRVEHWAEVYGNQLNKWLFKETFTTKKTILTYEGLKKNINQEFEKLCKHLNVPFDAKKLDAVQAQVTKEKLKQKTKHDPRVLNISNEYEEKRKSFESNNKKRIIDRIARINPALPGMFQ